MTKPIKLEPSEIDLIAWVIPQIAQGHYAVRDDSRGRELKIFEQRRDFAALESALLQGLPEATKQAFFEMRENFNFESMQNALVLLFGKN